MVDQEAVVVVSGHMVVERIGNKYIYFVGRYPTETSAFVGYNGSFRFIDVLGHVLGYYSIH